MAEIIAIANLKGGVGKSTIAVNLACSLRGPDRSAVVIDADSQGTSSFWSAIGSLPVQLRAMPLEDTDDRSWLKLLRRRKAEMDGRDAAAWLAELRQIEAHYVVIDCPPHVGLATRAAVWAADLVLVPVTASAADVSATRPALELITRARAARGDKGPKCLLVPSRVDRSTATGRTIESILKHLGEPVGPAIGQRIAFADSVAFGQWIGDFAPNSPAHREMTDLAYTVRRVLREKAKAR
jgi:chromosome partitioning protein